MVSKCPFCSHPSKSFCVAKDLNRRISKSNFKYCKCQKCGIVFISEIPTDLNRYYPKEYHSFPKSQEHLMQLCEREMFKLDILKRFKKSGKLLEIGPSIGSFLFLAKKEGFDVSGIEMDSDCAKYIEQTMGIHVHNTDDIVKAMTSLEKFDAIVLWHVAEHFVNPLDVFKVISSKLLEGGILILAMPNPNSIQFKFFKKNWYHLDAPRHLHLVPFRTLEKILKIHNLKCLYSTTEDKGGREWDRISWGMSLKNYLGIRIRGYGFIGRILRNCLKFLESNNFKGTTYTVVFQKEKSS